MGRSSAQNPLEGLKLFLTIPAHLEMMLQKGHVLGGVFTLHDHLGELVHQRQYFVA
jgi:hypothetical protein